MMMAGWMICAINIYYPWLPVDAPGNERCRPDLLFSSIEQCEKGLADWEFRVRLVWPEGLRKNYRCEEAGNQRSSLFIRTRIAASHAWRTAAASIPALSHHARTRCLDTRAIAAASLIVTSPLRNMRIAVLRR